MNIIIGIEDPGLALNSLIANRGPSAVRQGCMISAKQIGDTRFAEVVVTGSDHNIIKEKGTLCAVLADIIVENLQIRHMVRILKRSYYFLPEKEQCDILVRVLKRLWYPPTGQGASVAMCKGDIRKRLLDLLSENDTESIVLEGFMRFRMKDYLLAWEEQLTECVEDHIRKKEYADFVEILRLFVSIRIPRRRTLHVCVNADGQYILLDEKLCPIKTTEGAGIDKDDALLSALVNIAPQNIIVHNKDRFAQQRILETIKDVFGTRVAFSDEMI